MASGRWLPEKIFFHRNSVLTDLFKVSHIETVYHIFVATLLIFALNTIFSDIVEKGGLVHVYHIELVVWIFKGLFNVFHCWVMMFLFTCLLIYVAFMFWATKRKPVSKLTNFDVFFILIYITYQVRSYLKLMQTKFFYFVVIHIFYKTRENLFLPKITQLILLHCFIVDVPTTSKGIESKQDKV